MGRNPGHGDIRPAERSSETFAPHKCALAALHQNVRQRQITLLSTSEAGRRCREQHGVRSSIDDLSEPCNVSLGITIMRSTSDESEEIPLAALPKRITLTREITPPACNCATASRYC
jgi:hypothetical protein